MLKIVMYHYVRDLAASKHPRIKGLLVSQFEKQLDYIQSNYQVVSLEEIFQFLKNEIKLPDNACHLSFDDGFIDHFETVYPRLLERKMTASFYPSTAIFDSRVLDVHKIHFLLANVENVETIKNELIEEIEVCRKKINLPSNEELYQSYANTSRYDNAEVILIKRLLQVILPREIRRNILNNLFCRYVSDDEVAFAKELYMTLDQLKEMVANGMAVGGHGYEHEWLDRVEDQIQYQEVMKSKDLIKMIYGKDLPWMMCYPYGSYNAKTIKYLRQNACIGGLTTHPGSVGNASRPMELERINTNDLVEHC